MTRQAVAAGSGVLEHPNGALTTTTTRFNAIASAAAPIELHGFEASLQVTDRNQVAGDVRLREREHAGWETMTAPAGAVDGARGAGLSTSPQPSIRRELCGSVARLMHVLEIMTAMLDSVREGRRIDLITDIGGSLAPRLVTGKYWLAGRVPG